VWTLRDAIYDLPNARILTSQILNPGRDAVGPAAPPRGMLVPRSVLVRLVCATGLRYEPREQGTRAETRERHDRATHDRKLQHIMPARKLVYCSRGLGLLTSPDGVESQRPETTKVLHKNNVFVRDHLRDITRHHVIVVNKFVVVRASWTFISRSALVGLPRATLPVRSPVTHGHIVPHRTTFAQDCLRSSHATQADFVINGSPVLRY
jgi:hypothetical protein